MNRCWFQSIHHYSPVNFSQFFTIMFVSKWLLHPFTARLWDARKLHFQAICPNVSVQPELKPSIIDELQEDLRTLLLKVAEMGQCLAFVEIKMDLPSHEELKHAQAIRSRMLLCHPLQGCWSNLYGWEISTMRARFKSGQPESGECFFWSIIAVLKATLRQWRGVVTKCQQRFRTCIVWTKHTHYMYM